MKKICLITSMLFMITGCSKKYGYIYDRDTITPLAGVSVKDIQNPFNIKITEMDGKFSFSDCGNLIISKAGYKTDTLKEYGCKPSGKCFNGHIFYMEKKD